MQKIISCRLAPEEFKQRKSHIQETLKKRVVNKYLIEEGFAYRFVYSDEMIADITEFIRYELTCCNFLTFEVSIDEENVLLKIHGPAGTKEFLEQELGI